MNAGCVGGGGDARAQSEVIGVVLLLAITIAGATAIVAFGATAVNDTQEAATSGAAEQSMAKFDSKASLVAHGQSESQKVTLSGASDATRRIDEDAGWINVTVVNETTGNVETVVMNVSMGAVVYEDGTTSIAYQGGGVWRKTGSGNASTMISPPEFHYTGRTLTLPLVVVQGSGTIGERARITQQGDIEAKYPNESTSPARLNPLNDGQLNVTVKSQYYEAWGRFFQQRTGAAFVTYNHSAETVTVALKVPSKAPNTVSGSIFAGSAGGKLKLSGSGSNPAFTDSYNSSNGAYPSSKQYNGTIITAGEFETSGNAEVNGNVRTGANADLGGGADINGTVYWTTGFSATGSASYDDEEQISGVPDTENIDGLVQDRISTVNSTNDNGATTAVDGNRLNYTGGSVTLSDGEYYLTKVDMPDGNELIIDTDGNNVTIVVDGGFLVGKNTNITVQDGGTVRIFIQDDMDFSKGARTDVPGDRAGQLWFYGTDGATVDLGGSSGNPINVTGVLYVPSTDSNTEVYVQHADVYGGVVAGKVEVDSGGGIHYDEALESEAALGGLGGSVPRVTYLHVSVTRVNVTST